MRGDFIVSPVWEEEMSLGQVAYTYDVKKRIEPPTKTVISPQQVGVHQCRNYCLRWISNYAHRMVCRPNNNHEHQVYGYTYEVMA